MGRCKLWVSRLPDQGLKSILEPTLSRKGVYQCGRTTAILDMMTQGCDHERREEYDDSPWTREELQALAWEAGKHAGWEDMDEYDNDSGKP